MTTEPTQLPPRYGRLRLDSDLDQFHTALAWLKADTCERGCCDTQGAMCGKHRARARRLADREAVR